MVSSDHNLVSSPFRHHSRPDGKVGQSSPSHAGNEPNKQTSLPRYRPNIHETCFGVSGRRRTLSIVSVTSFPSRRRSLTVITPVQGDQKQWRQEVRRDSLFGDQVRLEESESLPRMEHNYLLPLRRPSSDAHYVRGEPFSFDYDITDEDEIDDISLNMSSRRNSAFNRSSNTRHTPPKPAQPWPCRPCGLFLGTCHILLGLSVIIFDVSTNWITETVFAITAGICFVNSGIVGLIAARKLDRGTVTLFVIFSLLSMGLSFVLIIECSVALNHACLAAAADSDPLTEQILETRDFHQELIGHKCIHSVEARVRAALLILALLEAVVGLVSIFVGGRSLCNRYAADFQNPASPYHALIYGDLDPPQPPKRIVQDVGREIIGGRSSSRLLLEYLVPSSPSVASPDRPLIS